MKKISRLLLGITSALVLTAVSSQAQWVYYDISDGLTNTITSVNTYDNRNANVLWGQGTDSAATYGYRYRFMSGPGTAGWNSNAYSGFATQNQFPVPGPAGNSNDPPLYTLITGLTPGENYAVRVYSVFANSATNAVVSSRTRSGGQYSLDGGTTWKWVDDKNSVTLNWVDNATALGTVQPQLLRAASGDARAFALLGGTVQADGSGVARIDLRLPGIMATGENNDRYHIDGYALTVIPEPGTVAVLGVGLSGLVMMLRRKRS